MPINNDVIVTVPAVTTPEKTYQHLWLTDIHIQASDNTSGIVNINAAPYNGDTGEVAENGPFELISTDNLWGAVQEVPEVALAMQAIFDAIEPLKAWLNPVEEE